MLIKSNQNKFFVYITTHIPYLLTVLLINSCAINRENIALPIEIDDSFEQDLTTEHQLKLPLADKWWQSLEDESLNLLIEDSLIENFTVRIAWDRLTQAAAALRRENSALFPSIEASNSNQRAELRQFFGDQIRTNWRSNFIARISASYELDIWGRLHSSSNAALNSFSASQEDLNAAAISVSAEIALVWYEIIELVNQQRILNNQEEINTKTRKLIILRFANGQVSVADILRQEQLLESISSEKELVNAQLEVAKNQLSLLRGKTPQKDEMLKKIFIALLSRDFKTDDRSLFFLPPQPILGIPKELITRRPDVKRALFQVQEADHRVASAIADRLPKISITAGLSTNSTAFRDIFKDWLYNIASNIVGPIFDAGLRASEVDRTKAVLSERLNNYAQIIVQSIVEVDNAISRENHQRLALSSLERQLELSDRVLSRIQARYNKGLVGYLDVLIALTNVQGLQRNILSSKRDLINHRIALYRSLAGSWDMLPPDPQVIKVGLIE